MAHKKITHLLLIFVFMICYVVSLPATAAPLHNAAKEGNLQQVVKLIEEGEDINAKDNYGGTALHLAVIYSHKDVVELLIAKGADVCANVNGVTPLHYATETINLKEGNDNYEIVKLLITHGADVNIKENSFGQYRNSPLHWAVLTAHRDIVELLIEKNVDINSMGEFRHTPLHIASSKNYLDLAKFLITKGADVNAKNEIGYTPLHNAAFCGHKDIVELLINNGADINTKGLGLFDYTPLRMAISQGHKDIVEYLLAKGADILSVNHEGRTPLHKAAVNGHIEILEFLLNKGIDVNIRDSSGVTPLGLAVGKHRDRKELPDIKDSKEYCERGDYFYRKNEFDRAIEDYTSAVLAKEENDYAFYRRGRAWAEKGNAEQAVNDWKKAIELNGRNILDIYHSKHLLQSPDSELERLMREAAFKYLNYLDRVSGYAVYASARPGDFYTVSLILSKPFEEEKFLEMVKDDNPVIRALALISLAREDITLYENIVRSFFTDTTEVEYVPYGCIVERITLDKLAKDIIEHPHILACWAPKHTEKKPYVPKDDSGRNVKKWDTMGVMQTLIEKGADVNTKDKSGNSPLHYAADNNSKSKAELLISKGADINAQNNEGETPLHCATFWGNKDMVELLIQNGADINRRTKAGWTPLQFAQGLNYKGLSDMLREHGATE